MLGGIAARAGVHLNFLALAHAGAGAFELGAAAHLQTVTKKTVEGRVKLGIETFAEALLGHIKVSWMRGVWGKHTLDNMRMLRLRRCLQRTAGTTHRRCSSSCRWLSGWLGLGWQFVKVWSAIVSTCVLVKEEQERGSTVGLDVATGEAMQPGLAGVLDNYIVKKQVGSRLAA